MVQKCILKNNAWKLSKFGEKVYLQIQEDQWISHWLNLKESMGDTS